jgi:photosystem II stability/assembly factor-like uncharacterized protein
MFPKRFFTLTLLAALVLFADSASVAQNFWEPCNGAPVGSVFAITSNSHGDVFVGNYDGIYRSINNGQSWQTVSNSFVPDYCLGLAVDSNDNVFAMEWPDGPYRSTDNGLTWEAIYSGLPATNTLPATVEINVFAGGKSGLLFVGMTNGVYRSTNSGDSWLRADSGLTDTDVVALAVTRTGTLLAGTYSGFFRSSDSGNSWKAFDTTFRDIGSIQIDDNNRIFALAWPGYLIRSTDNGATWDSINTGLVDSILGKLAIERGGKLFMSTSKAGAFQSTDHGDSWTRTGLGLRDTDISIMKTNGRGYIFAGTYDSGLFYSKDDGMSWQSTGYGIESANLVFALPDGKILASTNTGAFLSSDEGDTWAPLDVNWNPSTNVSPVIPRYCLSPSGSVFIAGDSGLFRSTDMCETWKKNYTDSSHSNSMIYSLIANSAGHLFITVPKGNFRSTSDGNSWIPMDSNMGQILAFSKGYLFAGVYSSSQNAISLFRSSDEGDTWKKVCDNFPFFSTISVDPEGNLILGGNGEIFQSTDTGETWHTIDNGLYLDYQSVVALGNDSSGNLFAGVNGTSYGSSPGIVYRSSDDGKTWQEFDAGLVYNALSFSTNPRGRIFEASAFGVYRQINLPVASVESDAIYPSSLHLSQNSPNPVTQSTTISFTLGEPSYITLTLYDATGREVAALANGFMDAGAHDVPFQRSDLPSGVYFYRLESGGKSATRGMVVLP